MESLFYSPKNNIYVSVSPCEDVFSETTEMMRNYGIEFHLFMNRDGVMDEKQKQLFYEFIDIKYGMKKSGTVEQDVLKVCKELEIQGNTAKPVYNHGDEFSYAAIDDVFGHSVVGFMVVSNRDLQEQVVSEEEKEVVTFLNLQLANYNDIMHADNIGNVTFYDKDGNIIWFNHHVRFDEKMNMIDNLAYILSHNSFDEDKVGFMGRYSEYAFDIALDISIKDKNNEFSKVSKVIDENGEIFIVGLHQDTVVMFGDNDIKKMSFEDEMTAEEVFDLIVEYKTMDIEEILIEEDIFSLQSVVEYVFGDER